MDIYTVTYSPSYEKLTEMNQPNDSPERKQQVKHNEALKQKTK